MNLKNNLPKSVQDAAKAMCGTQQEAEYKAKNAPEEIRTRVQEMLDRSQSFTSLNAAIEQAMQDRKEKQWSHVLSTWDEDADKYWVVRRQDPDYGLVCFSGLRFVVPIAAVEAAWEALTDTTDTIEEV